MEVCYRLAQEHGMIYYITWHVILMDSERRLAQEETRWFHHQNVAVACRCYTLYTAVALDTAAVEDHDFCRLSISTIRMQCFVDLDRLIL